MTGRFQIPSRRPGKRFYRYRPGKGGSGLRRNRMLRRGLLALSVIFLLLFGVSQFRSLQTALQNKTYAGWRSEPESVPAPSAVVRSTAVPQLARMGLPDGTPITKTRLFSSDQPASVSLQGTKFHTVTGFQLPEMQRLLSKNRDLVAWLTIDRVLDLPVVYRDNSWYLNHDFEGGKSASGTVFLDAYHPLKESSQILLLHGHNMKDGSMFAPLTHYQKSAYWRKHPFIHLTTLWEKEEYVVFAVIRASTDTSEEDYENWFARSSFSSDEQFDEYLELIRSHSVIPSWLSVNAEDALLELSTCVGEDRLVVFARRIRTDETISNLRRLIE